MTLAEWVMAAITAFAVVGYVSAKLNAKNAADKLQTAKDNTEMFRRLLEGTEHRFANYRQQVRKQIAALNSHTYDSEKWDTIEDTIEDVICERNASNDAPPPDDSSDARECKHPNLRNTRHTDLTDGTCKCPDCNKWVPMVYGKPTSDTPPPDFKCACPRPDTRGNRRSLSGKCACLQCGGVY